MNVLIEPHLGSRRSGSRIINDSDTGVDHIAIESSETPVPRIVGYVGRQPLAPICLIYQLSEAEHRAIEKAVADRHGKGKRKVNVAPPVAEFEQAVSDDSE